MDKIFEVRKLLAEKQVDAILLYKPANVSWISDFTGDSSMVIVAEKAEYFITDSRYTEQAEKEIPASFEIKEIRAEVRYKVLNDIMTQNNVKKLGIEGQYITLADMKDFEQAFSAEYVMVDNEITALRAVKTEAELKIMRKAANITQDCFDHLLGYIKAGVSETDILAEMAYYFNKHGAGGASFNPIIAGGPNSSMPHAQVTDRILKPGDLLTMDFGCEIKGYKSDFTRTIAISGLEPDMKVVYNTVRTAQRAAMDALKPGFSGKEADKIARDIIYGAGYEGLFGHSLGHGVGLEVHESPRLSMYSTDIMKENMVVTVEPGIYIPGKGGVRIEDTVVITENGMESFYTATTELLII
ncbi:MAG: aminopeptidase P family protein [Christensenellaceae bacterium]|nr:aminopeptidase P family protein [Christensenellaceae bacterium]